MGLVSFSSDYLKDSFTLIDNIFINDYLPFAPDEAVKVYIFCVHISSVINHPCNSIEKIAETLSLTNNDIMNSFKYWEDKKLMKIINETSLKIKLLPLKESLKAHKKFDGDKYNDFNTQLQDLFPQRMISPNEYSEYYYLLETTRMSQEAMLMIVKYCIDIKGDKIRYPYIHTVARNWANEGILTVNKVEARLRDLEATDQDMRDLFRALNKSGSPTLNDREDYNKWIKQWKFTKETVLYVCTTFKRGGMTKLDRLLDDYRKLEIYDIKDIENHSKHKKKLYEIAIEVNKTLGIFYQSLDNIIETYISPWINKGFDQATLKKIANFCFTNSLRTLEGMNEMVNKFYKLGLLSVDSINMYLNGLVRNDNKIKLLLELAGVNKNVTASDRNYYKTWTENWFVRDELIKKSAELACGRGHVFSYMNKTLSNWKNSGINSLEDLNKKQGVKPATKEKSFEQREYSKDELNALFDDIENLRVE